MERTFEVCYLQAFTVISYDKEYGDKESQGKLYKKHNIICFYNDVFLREHVKKSFLADASAN